jgi:ribosomal protein L34E
VISEARGTEWVVYAKRPFGGPRTVLKYLARYTHTHRVAISNYRLLSSEDGTVAFRYKDYARGRRLRTLRLEATEFIRRFLLHALPRGFVRIRRYGLLANAQREQKLARCRELLSGLPRNRPSEAPYTEITAYEPGGYRCPSCGEGIMRRLHLAFSCASLRPRPPPVQESS